MYHPKQLLLAILCLTAGVATAQNADAILGNWKAEEKVLTIHIYRQDSEYRGKIISYQDRHHPEKDPAAQQDEHNPNPALRQRHLIGMDVLTGLHFNPSSHTWEKGTVYSPGNGSSYSAYVKLNGEGKLEVRAYKGFSLFGKTMIFRRE